MEKYIEKLKRVKEECEKSMVLPCKDCKYAAFCDVIEGQPRIWTDWEIKWIAEGIKNLDD